MEKIINSDATHEKVRAKYGIVAELCRTHKVRATQVYYASVRGARGTDKGRKAVEGARILSILRDECLLVEDVAC